jgi:hypothetical protein
MRPLLALLLVTITSGIVSEANALDKQGLDAIDKAVQHICVQPAQKGTYLKIEGDLNVGATLKIVGVNGTGKITKETWDGISQTADQYKTDPRQCAMAITPVLTAAMNQPNGSSSNPYPSADLCPPNSIKLIDSEASYNGHDGISAPANANICFVRVRTEHNGHEGIEIRNDPK